MSILHISFALLIKGWFEATSPIQLELGNLPISTLLNEVKRLHDIAYELGIEERKEMTRGKYINIFRKKN